jgi:hypothetical protein
MKLKELIQSLKGSKSRPPVTKITVTSCTDRKQEFSNFLLALQHTTTLAEITIRSDFLTDLTDTDDDDDDDDDDDGNSSSSSSLLSRFLNVLTELDTLDELEILSSSRFHIDIMPARAFQLFPRNLKRLILEDFQVTADHTSIVQALAVALSHSPTATSAAAAAAAATTSLSSSSSSCTSSLVQVSLNNFFANDYSNTGEVPYVLDPLLFALATIPNLQHLELTGCGSHALADAHVSPLISPACLTHFLHQRAFTLQTLELSFLEFQEIQFQAITTTLQQVPPTTTTTTTGSSPSASHCYALQTLHLNYHKWSPTSFEQLMTAMCLPPLQLLQDVSVRSLSTIGTTGYQQALHMLQHNYTCTSLAVTATPYQQAQLDLYVRLNQAGRHLLRCSNGTSTSTSTNTRGGGSGGTTMVQWINVLAHCSHDLDVTRHLLAELPSLCATAAGNRSRNKETKEEDNTNTIKEGRNLKHASPAVGGECNTAAATSAPPLTPKANSIPISTPAA